MGKACHPTEDVATLGQNIHAPSMFPEARLETAIITRDGHSRNVTPGTNPRLRQQAFENMPDSRSRAPKLGFEAAVEAAAQDARRELLGDGARVCGCGQRLAPASLHEPYDVLGGAEKVGSLLKSSMIVGCQGSGVV